MSESKFEDKNLKGMSKKSVLKVEIFKGTGFSFNKYKLSVRIDIGELCSESEYAKDPINPVWNEFFEFPISDALGDMKFSMIAEGVKIASFRFPL